MKTKYIFATLLLAMAAMACKKIDPNNPFGKEEAKYFISGSSEQIAGKDYLWHYGDAVAVMNRQNTTFEYKLVDGDGKTAAKFGSVQAPDFGGESTYYAIYPSSAVTKDKLIWPNAQYMDVNNSTIADPRFATGSINGTTLGDGTFYSLGGVLEVNLNLDKESASVYIGRINIKADQLICGEFEAQTTSEGDARVARIQEGSYSSTELDVYLDTADSLGLFMQAGKSYTVKAALPESPEDGFTGISVSLYDGSGLLMGTFNCDDTPVLQRAGSASVSVDVDIDPVSKGIFSVSESKRVRFATGNLFVDTTSKPVSAGFEVGKIYKTYERKANHVALFFWSSDFAISYSEKYKDDKRDISDCLLGRCPEIFSIYGLDWSLLSTDEWDYLLNKRLMDNNVTRYLSADDGIYIFPDNSKGTNDENAVILPYTSLIGGLKWGLYWSNDSFDSTKSDIGEGPIVDEDQAHVVMFRPQVAKPGTGAMTNCSMLRNEMANIRFVSVVE